MKPSVFDVVSFVSTDTRTCNKVDFAEDYKYKLVQILLHTCNQIHFCTGGGRVVR